MLAVFYAVGFFTAAAYIPTSNNTCPSLDKDNIPLDYVKYQKNIIHTVLEFKLTKRQHRFKNVASNYNDPSHTYRIEGTVVRAYPETIFNNLFSGAKRVINAACVHDKNQGDIEGLELGKKVLIYTTAKFHRRKGTPILKIKQSKNTIVVPYSDRQIEVIKRRMATNYLDSIVNFPTLTDEPRVRVSIRSIEHGPNSSIRKKLFDYSVVKKHKTKGIRKFNIKADEKNLVLTCQAIGGAAYLNWRFYQNGKISKAEPSNQRKYSMAPSSCLSKDAVKCTEIRLLINGQLTRQNNA